MTEPEVLTSGMVGRELRLEFSPDWDGLSKTVVFSNGTITLDVVCTGETVVIPAKILEKPLKRVTVGVYGVSGGGKLVIPTVRAEGPEILPGVDPSGDPAADPALPIWAQIQGLIGDTADLETEDASCLVAAINELAVSGGSGENGATFTPHMDQSGELSWTNDKGLENPSSVCLMGPEGPQGEAGETPVIDVYSITGGHRLRIILNQEITHTDILDGQDGYSPVRGTDYWTEEDKAEIKAYVDEAILGGTW